MHFPDYTIYPAFFSSFVVLVGKHQIIKWAQEQRQQKVLSIKGDRRLIGQFLIKINGTEVVE